MSHAWGKKAKAALGTAGNKITDVASNVKDDITRKKHITKDAEFNELQKQFDEKAKLISQLTHDVVAFMSGSEAILKAQKELAEDLLKVAPDRSPMAILCQEQIETADKMFSSKAELDKQFGSSFTDPINAYQGQYREVSDRIRERSRRETEVDKLATERDKFKEKGDARLAATETKLETAIAAYEELNAELKKDIPLLLEQAESFFLPLMQLMIILQSQFWSQMAQVAHGLSQKVDPSKAFIPQLPPVITAKNQSAMMKKFSALGANPWERPPPALPGTAPVAALPAPYSQPPIPQAGYGQPPIPQQPGYGQPPVPQQPGYGQPPVPQQPGYGQPPVPQVPLNPFAQPPPQSQPSASPRPPPRAMPTPPTPQFPQAKALWDFTGQDHTELSFRAGDIIKVQLNQGDWWTGELAGRSGLFPANYVQMI